MINNLFDSLGQKLIESLPHNYTKSISSNLGKIIQLFSSELEEINEIKDEIELSRDIDQASGRYLDRSGKNIGERRGSFNDTIYRLLIKSRIQQNFSPGDVNSLIEYISTILQVDRSAVDIKEPSWGSFRFSSMEDDSQVKEGQGFGSGLFKKTNPEPASFEIYVPFTALNDSAIPAQTFINIIDRLRATGVSISLTYEGTFAFSSINDESEFVEEKGFNSGYFGGYYNPSR